MRGLTLIAIGAAHYTTKPVSLLEAEASEPGTVTIKVDVHISPGDDDDGTAEPVVAVSDDATARTTPDTSDTAVVPAAAGGALDADAAAVKQAKDALAVKLQAVARGGRDRLAVAERRKADLEEAATRDSTRAISQVAKLTMEDVFDKATNNVQAMQSTDVAPHHGDAVAVGLESAQGNVMTEAAKLQDAAAAKLQAAARGRQGRLAAADLKDKVKQAEDAKEQAKDAAAEVLQAAARGRLDRLAMAKRREADLKEAAAMVPSKVVATKRDSANDVEEHHSTQTQTFHVSAPGAAPDADKKHAIVTVTQPKNGNPGSAAFKIAHTLMADGTKTGMLTLKHPGFEPGTQPTITEDKGEVTVKGLAKGGKGQITHTIRAHSPNDTHTITHDMNPPIVNEDGELEHTIMTEPK